MNTSGPAPLIDAAVVSPAVTSPRLANPAVPVDAVVNGTDVDLTRSASDAGSGVSHCDVDVQVDGA